MIDWSNCLGVEQIPGKVSGARLFADSRLPLSALFENLEAGATVEECTDWFAPVDEVNIVLLSKAWPYAESRIEETGTAAIELRAGDLAKAWGLICQCVKLEQ